MTLNPDRFSSAGVPGKFIQQYFHPWAIDEKAFAALMGLAERMNPATHIEDLSRVPDAARLQLMGADSSAQVRSEDGVSIVRIEGALTKYGSSFGGGTSSVSLRKAIRTAARDESTSAIVLEIDSPGGSVAGIADVVDDIKQARESKPVVAYVEDMAASAAYWIASAADSILSNRTALVGNVGTMIGLYDYSGQAAADGVKAVLIKSGEFKGMGMPGAEITDAQKAELSREVAAINKSFVGAVTDGRKLTEEQLKDVTTARTYVGEEAVTIGLVDRIGTLDDAKEAAKQIGISRGSAGRPQSVANNTPAKGESTMDLSAITIDALKAGRPDIVESLTKAEAARATTAATEQERTRVLAILDACSEYKADAKTARELIEGGKCEADAKNRVQADRIKALESSAPQAPGASATSDDGDVEAAPVATATDEESLKKLYAKSPALQAEFGDAETFIAYRKAEQAGRIRGVK